MALDIFPIESNNKIENCLKIFDVINKDNPVDILLDELSKPFYPRSNLGKETDSDLTLETKYNSSKHSFIPSEESSNITDEFREKKTLQKYSFENNHMAFIKLNKSPKKYEILCQKDVKI